MFKKILALTLGLFLIAGIAQAAAVTKDEILDATFNAVTTSANSDSIDIQGYSDVAFFVVYDETQVGNSISAAITLDYSYDGTNWIDASFLDFAGGLTTLQTSETISADGWYYFWISPLGTTLAPYCRVAVAATNTDVDDLLDVNVYIVTRE